MVFYQFININAAFHIFFVFIFGEIFSSFYFRRVIFLGVCFYCAWMCYSASVMIYAGMIFGTLRRIYRLRRSDLVEKLHQVTFRPVQCTLPTRAVPFVLNILKTNSIASHMYEFTVKVDIAFALIHCVRVLISIYDLKMFHV